MKNGMIIMIKINILLGCNQAKDTIYKLLWNGNNELEWKTMEQKLKHPRSETIIMYIPNEMTTCSFKDGSVRFLDKKFPEVFYNGKWSPICGHVFWDNQFGATLFCNQINETYLSGFEYNSGSILYDDSVSIGGCNKNTESLLECGSFDENYGGCSLGDGASIAIKCCCSGKFLIIL